jgi:hypothetical protein
VAGAMGADHGPRSCRRPLRLVAGGEGRAPVVAVLAPVMKRHSSASAHPKASAPSAVTHFSCKAATSEGAALGASVPIMDPRSWRRPRLCGRLGAEVMPPLWQYFLRLREKTA